MALTPHRNKRRTLIGQLFVMAGIFKCAFSEMAEVCTAEDLEISCEYDEIIAVKSAEFGRMELGRCIKKEDEFLGCTNDVLPLLDKWCSGRRDCSVRVSNEDLEAANTNCLDILKQYLKVEYSCIKVGMRCKSNEPNGLHGNSGYISSSTMDTKGCGSLRSPWIISADPGQTIRLHLIDFAASVHNSNLVSCRSVYGYILEKTLGINHTVCGGRTRDEKLYVSKTNRVEVVLVPSEKRARANFLIKYTVSGCPELPRPAHAWYKREGDVAVFGCENSNKEWRLTCSGTTWQGETGNCTETVTVVKPEVSRPAPFTLSSVVIISGIAGAAVVLSVVAVMTGIIYLNRYRIRQEVKRSDLYKTYLTLDRNTQGFYRPSTLDHPTNSGACWDRSLQTNGHDALTSFPDACTCATLQMREDRPGDKTVDALPSERQSLYSSIKSN